MSYYLRKPQHKELFMDKHPIKRNGSGDRAVVHSSTTTAIHTTKTDSNSNSVVPVLVHDTYEYLYDRGDGEWMIVKNKREVVMKDEDAGVVREKYLELTKIASSPASSLVK